MTGRAAVTDLLLAAGVLAVAAYAGLAALAFSPFAQVFPLLISALTALVAVLIAALAWAGRLPAPPVAEGSTARRLALCGALVIWIAAIGWIGFIPAGLLGFVLTGLAARHEPWRSRDWARFLLIAAACVAGLSLFFIHALNVPLPGGSLFRG
jgi:hypothetical protein